MKDKKSFGDFIAEKRKELNLTQSELAKKLFVTKTAVSKWERGVTYPDITLISDLCKVLNVDEHELISESDSAEYRKIHSDAKKYKIISDVLFWGFTGTYSIALFTCFICNIAVDKKLSWFFIVLTSIITAFTLFPSISRFFKKFKLLIVSASFVVSLFILLLTCCIYSHGNWFFIATLSILLGYSCIFLPIFARIYPLPASIKRHAGIIYLSMDFILLILLLLSCLYKTPAIFGRSILISLYCLTPILITVLTVSYIKINKYFKGAIILPIGGIFIFFVDIVASKIFDYSHSFYINFFNWKGQNINGNVLLIVLIFCITTSLLLSIIGIFKRINQNKN